MRCPNCQRLILNNTPNCPYCGQAVSSSQSSQTNQANSMFAANPMPAQTGISPIEHHEAVAHEIKKRHWQRYVFYGLIVLIIGASVWLIVKIYNDNSTLLLAVTQNKQALTQAQAAITAKDQQIQQVNDSLKQAQDALDQETNKYKTDVTASAGAVKDLQQCKIDLTSSDANIYNLILTLGVGVSNANLDRIPLADANLNMGPDADQDGLSDEVEASLGTDPNKADTDGDGFSDKAELLSGFDPLHKNAKLPIDTKFAASEKGKILIQIEGTKAAWYVNPADGKRYFLGQPANGYKAMRSINYWTKNYIQQ